MQKLKTKKGITLIALIITIIVMLILVGVTISVALNGGLFEQARDAKKKTEAAVKADQDLLLMGVETWWDQEGTTIKDLVSGQTLEIGTPVNYNHILGAEETSKSMKDPWGYTTEDTIELTSINLETDKWLVLGTDDLGRLLLIPSKPVQNSNASSDNIYISNLDDLDEYCSMFGQGPGAAGARSLTVEDVNKITGYNPNDIDGNETKYGAGEIYEYGTTITCTWENDAAVFRGNGKECVSGYVEQNNGYDEVVGKTFISDVYEYNHGITGLFSGNYVALKSTCTDARGLDDSGYTIYTSLRTISASKVNATQMLGGGANAAVVDGIYPVVILESGVKLTDEDSDGEYEVGATFVGTNENQYKKYVQVEAVNNGGPSFVIISGTPSAGSAGYYCDINATGEGDCSCAIHIVKSSYGNVDSVDGEYIIFGSYPDSYVKYKYECDLYDQEVLMDLQ